MYDVIPVVSPKKYDCGATCLKMLLAYYGTEVDLDVLDRECNTRLIGCTGADLIRVARLHGMTDITAYQIDADELILQDRPAIIWWKYQHWCVFCGLDADGSVWIVNPDKGRFRLSRENFMSMYTGVALFNGNPVTIQPDASLVAKDNIPKGGHFIANDVVYEAVTAIPRGAAILPGVNCFPVSLDDMIGG